MYEFEDDWEIFKRFKTYLKEKNVCRYVKITWNNAILYLVLRLFGVLKYVKNSKNNLYFVDLGLLYCSNCNS